MMRFDNIGSRISFYLHCRTEQTRRWAYRQLLSFRHRGLARYHVLWGEPLVILAALAPGVELLFPVPARALVLLFLNESAEESPYFTSAVKFIRNQQRRCPLSHCVILANTLREVDLFLQAGCNAIFLNHNAFLDERIFTSQPEVAKRFDAVYDAQLSPYKRHYLAARVSKLALISYMYHPSPDLAYARAVRRELAHATWLNDPLAKNWRSLQTSEVASALNASRVGLCLSESEGAMYASGQYLLCGLPVVTTPSKGGRDHFFEPDFALTVDAIPEAVTAGVVEMMRRAPDPNLIRQRTLSRMHVLRSRFVDIVQEHLDRNASGSDFPFRFHRDFFHTMVRSQRPPRRWV